MSWSEECPNCHKELGITLSNYFWCDVVGTANTSEFEYKCPYCHEALRVTVETEPVFTVNYKNQ